jgi:hypothetical protein
MVKVMAKVAETTEDKVVEAMEMTEEDLVKTEEKVVMEGTLMEVKEMTEEDLVKTMEQETMT